MLSELLGSADAILFVWALASAALAFLLSASAGLGGSLLLVPMLALLLGTKQGIATAALLLMGNNIAKVIAYRRTIPVRAVAAILILTIVGTAIGAQLLTAAPESWVSIAIVATFIASFIGERFGPTRLLRSSPLPLAFVAGVTSGFSGTSGPLKGVALRNLGLDRFNLVGAASAISLAGDAMKTAVFATAGLLDQTSWTLVILAIPIMAVATACGRHINSRIGERAFTVLFWAVIAGYSAKLLVP